jgi:hypothetical protein
VTRQFSLVPEFVEFIPEELADGVLYVSIPYATAVHRCCCGCSSEVVTPLTRTDWSLTYDGESVSLDPSIGNWNFDCQSHYWITRNQVHWAARWTREQIDTGRDRDRLRKAVHYEGHVVVPQEPAAAEAPQANLRRRLLNHLRRFLRRR